MTLPQNNPAPRPELDGNPYRADAGEGQSRRHELLHWKRLAACIAGGMVLGWLLTPYVSIVRVQILWTAIGLSLGGLFGAVTYFALFSRVGTPPDS